MMILKETKIKKDIELDKYKNLARHLANEVEYLLDEIESLKKQLNILTIIKNNNVNPSTNRKNGDIVKEKIEEFRQDLKQQKKDLLDKKI